jgi:hypothetical protein
MWTVITFHGERYVYRLIFVCLHSPLFQPKMSSRNLPGGGGKGGLRIRQTHQHLCLLSRKSGSLHGLLQGQLQLLFSLLFFSASSILSRALSRPALLCVQVFAKVWECGPVASTRSLAGGLQTHWRRSTFQASHRPRAVQSVSCSEYGA